MRAKLFILKKIKVMQCNLKPILVIAKMRNLRVNLPRENPSFRYNTVKLFDRNNLIFLDISVSAYSLNFLDFIEIGNHKRKEIFSLLIILKSKVRLE